MRGIRDTLKKNLAGKRDAQNIVDTVNADEVGRRVALLGYERELVVAPLRVADADEGPQQAHRVGPRPALSARHRSQRDLQA